MINRIFRHEQTDGRKGGKTKDGQTYVQTELQNTICIDRRRLTTLHEETERSRQ